MFVAIAVVLVIAVLGGCSDDSEAGPEVDDGGTTSSTTSTVAEDEEADAALAVWQEYVIASEEWLDPPNPAHPRIPEFIASDALEDFRAGIARDRAKDIATRRGPSGAIQHHSEVASSSPSEVVIRDCFVDDSVGYDMNTGEVVDDAVVTLTIDVTLVPEGAAWKIRDIAEVVRRDGVASCE